MQAPARRVGGKMPHWLDGAFGMVIVSGPWNAWQAI
jgi:hypothetical protein